MGHELEAVDEPRPRPAEVRGRVDRDDPPRARRPQLVAVAPRLLERALAVVSARHDDDDLGPRRGHDLPRRLLGVLAGEAEDVAPAGELDDLRRPMAGD